MTVCERTYEKDEERKKQENGYSRAMNRPVFQYNLPKIFDILFTSVNPLDLHTIRACCPTTSIHIP